MIGFFSLFSLCSCLLLLNIGLIDLIFGATYCDDEGSDSSCADATISAGETYYCRGYESCEGSDFADDNYPLYCQGDNACVDASFASDDTGDYLYAYGYRSADSLYMEGSGDYVYCHGYQSCVDLNQTCDDSDRITYTYGYQSLQSADVYGNAAIYSNGFESLQNTRIDTDGVTTFNAYLYGYYSGSDSYILCRDGSTCSIYAYGWYATSNFSVLCYAGSECNIYCGDLNGCEGLTMYCYSTATCYFDCDDADSCPEEEDAQYLSSMSNGAKSPLMIDQEFDNLVAKKENDRISAKKIAKTKRVRENMKYSNSLLSSMSGKINAIVNDNLYARNDVITFVAGFGAALLLVFMKKHCSKMFSNHKKIGYQSIA